MDTFKSGPLLEPAAANPKDMSANPDAGRANGARTGDESPLIALGRQS